MKEIMIGKERKRSSKEEEANAGKEERGKKENHEMLQSYDVGDYDDTILKTKKSITHLIHQFFVRFSSP